MTSTIQQAHAEMVSSLAKPGTELIKNWTHKDAHNIHMVIGVVGEVMELRLAFSGQLNNLTHFIEECGDIEFYMRGLAEPNGLIADRGQHTHRGELIDYILRLEQVSEMLLDAVKRNIIYGNALEDTNFYGAMEYMYSLLDLIYLATDITLEEVLQANIDKLDKRYKGRKYSDEQANARADKANEKA